MKDSMHRSRRSQPVRPQATFPVNRVGCSRHTQQIGPGRRVGLGSGFEVNSPFDPYLYNFQSDFYFCQIFRPCNSLYYTAFYLYGSNVDLTPFPALQGTRLPLRPTGFSVYASPVLFANFHVDSATGARLDTGGWLTLTRRGLSPRKICRAFPGAITTS
jgi:hypothetical protein